jgi:DNA repair protein RecN (Recombination protein N)
VSICGQHAHQTLLKPEEHLYLLDAFANLEGQRSQVERGAILLKKIADQIKKTQKDLAERELKRDFLNLQINELEAAELDPAEEAGLKAERSFLANAEKVMRLGSGADHTLYAADQGSVLENLSKVRDMLIDLARLDQRAKPMADTVEEAYYQLDDAATELRDYLSGLSFDHGRLDWIESRLASLQRLVRKYGGDVQTALLTLDQAKKELAGLEKGEDTLKELEGQFNQTLAQTLAQAEELSARRKESGRRLAKAVEAELKELGMEHCHFEVRFPPPGHGALETEKGPLALFGLEEVHFYLAPNPGEGCRPLAQIASGGELSRILLALQTLAAHKRSAGLQVFDEVDAGIGGAIGSAVGRKLARLSKDMQVICITHLPQIAAWGDRHFVVQKEVKNGRTATKLNRLDQDKRVHELTRMLAGEGDGQAAREHARQMLSAAFSQKQNPRPVA